MAEENLTDAQKEGKRIAREYLSKLGWVRAARRTAERHILPAWTREDREEIFREDDQKIEDAEELFGQEVDRYRKEGSQFAKEVLRTIVKQLGRRTDLGFFGKRIVARIKGELRG